MENQEKVIEAQEQLIQRLQQKVTHLEEEADNKNPGGERKQTSQVVDDLTERTETRVRELLCEQCEFFNDMKEDLVMRSDHNQDEMKCIKADLANFNRVNKDFLAAVKDKMVRHEGYFFFFC